MVQWSWRRLQTFEKVIQGTTLPSHIWFLRFFPQSIGEHHWPRSYHEFTNKLMMRITWGNISVSLVTIGPVVCENKSET